MKIQRPVEKLRVETPEGEKSAKTPGCGARMAFDAGKVAAIKAAMAAGTFKVNAEAVADKLIASVTDVLASRLH